MKPLQNAVQEFNPNPKLRFEAMSIGFPFLLEWMPSDVEDLERPVPFCEGRRFPSWELFLLNDSNFRSSSVSSRRRRRRFTAKSQTLQNVVLRGERDGFTQGRRRRGSQRPALLQKWIQSLIATLVKPRTHPSFQVGFRRDRLRLCLCFSLPCWFRCKPFLLQDRIKKTLRNERRLV